MIKVIELFAGIGAWKKALTNLNIENSTIPIEIDIDTYNAYIKIHGQKIAFNDCNSAKDITKLKIDYLQADLIVMSPPCQGFSNAKQTNKNNELDKERNNLISYTLPIIEKTMPRYVIVENVPNFQFSKQNKDFILEMRKLDYHYDNAILNSLDFNWPQHRKRYFGIYFKYHKDYKNFNWPPKEKLTKTIADIIFTDEAIKNREDVSNNYKPLPNNAKLRQNGNGYIWGDYIDNRCYKWSGYVGTLTATFNQPYILCADDTHIRKLTALESGLLMGFTIEDHKKLLQSNPKLKEKQILKMYGNSIVVPVIEKIFKQLNFKE